MSNTSLSSIRVIRCCRSISIRRDRIWTFLWAIVACLIVLSESSAQHAKSPAGNATGSPAGSYGISEIENINLFSGKLSAAIPIMQVGGRGEASYTMSIPIKSSQWLTESHPDQDALYVYAINHPDNIVQGWRTLFQRPFEFGTISFRYTARYPGCYDGSNNWSCYQTAAMVVIFTSADGTEYALYDEKRGGASSEGTGLGGPYSPGLDRGLIFSSKDGTGWSFVADPPSVGVNDYSVKVSTGDFPGPQSESATSEIAASGVLKNSSGVSIRFDAGRAQYIKDRNGNTTTFVYETVGQKKLDKVLDSNGRTVDVTYGNGFDSVEYKGVAGQSRTVYVSYTTLQNRLAPGNAFRNIHSLFPAYPNQSLFSNYTIYPNPPVISQVSFPDNRSYQIYYNSYGEIGTLIAPTGAKVEYIHGAGMSGAHPSGQIGNLTPPNSGYPDVLNSNVAIYRRLLERREYADGATHNLSTVYGLFSTGKVREEQVDISTATILSRTDHFFNGSPTQYLFADSSPFLGYEPGQELEGREFKTEKIDPQSGTILSRAESFFDGPCLGPRSSCGIGNNPLPWSIYISKAENSLYDANIGQFHVSKTEFLYDNYDNLTDTFEYQSGIGVAGSLITRSHTDHVSGSSYTSALGPHLRSLPMQTWVSSDASGLNRLSLSQVTYDAYTEGPRSAALLDRYLPTGHDTANFGINFSLRGNVTSSTVYLNPQLETGAISFHYLYDILGNSVKNYDGNGNPTQLDFSDRFGVADAESTSNTAPTTLNGSYTYCYVTRTTNAVGWLAYAQYDYATGQEINRQDANGVVSKTVYQDLLDRPTQIVAAVGTPEEIQSNILYDDENQTVLTTSDLFTLGDGRRKNERLFDKKGRLVETRTYGEGTYVSVKREYDVLGRTRRVSNPRSVSSGSPLQWSENKFDSLGRVTERQTPDGAIATIEYQGLSITVTDQAGKKRRSILNGIGQVIRVDEADSNNSLGPASSPYQSTSYEYDPLGRLVHVIQGVQHRWFMYDPLGRLLRVKQPEQAENVALQTSGNPGNNSWSYGFSYDSNGNTLTATDAKNVTATSQYDALNRTVQRSFNDNPQTPTANFYYDGVGLPSVPPFSIGKLTKSSNGVSESLNTAFDRAGRILSHTQKIDGVSYVSGYEYSLSGAVSKEIYPSGREVNIAFDPDGDISSISGKTSSNLWRLYANSFSYFPDGRIQKVRLGNGIWETAEINNRGQLTSFGLGRGSTNPNLWQNLYEYGEMTGSNTVDSQKNSGNIARQTVSFEGLANSFVQSYTYDSMNRLIDARETSGNSQVWRHSTSYDRYGNRLSSEKWSGANQIVLPMYLNPQVDNATNRLLENQGFQYDANGSLINDPNGNQYRFDGNNLQTEIRDSNNSVIGTYLYDAEGKRVKKVTQYDATTFVYSGSGKLIAEYSTNSNSKLKDAISYTISDNLGSPRVILDSLGRVISRRDFMPFGESIEADGTYRKTSDKYGIADGVKQGFTGYFQDEESDLDYAQARMYFNSHGRFTAADPLVSSGKASNPQTLNRYVYALNNPLFFTDPTGLQSGKRIWVRDEGNKTVYKSSTTRPEGARLVTGVQRVKGDDGFIYRVTSRSIIGIGKWNRNVPTPPQGISPTSTPGTPDTRARDLGTGAKAGVRQALTNGVAALPVAVCIIGVCAAAGGAVAAGVVAIGSTTIGAAAIGLAVGAAGGGVGMTIFGEGSPGGSSGGLPDEVTDRLTDINDRHGVESGRCDCNADETLQVFTDAGIDAVIIEIRTDTQYLTTKDGRILSNRDEGAYHRVVLAGNRVFDALTGPAGKTWEEYLDLLQLYDIQPRLEPVPRKKPLP